MCMYNLYKKNFTESIEVPRMKIDEQIISYEANCPYHVQLLNISHMNPHFHSKELELVYCLEGHVDLVAGHQKVRIHAGEIFSVDYRDIHYIYSDEENITLLFHLDLAKLDVPFETLSNIFFSCESSHCYPYQQEAMNRIKDILLALAYEWVCNLPASDVLPNKLLHILLDYFNWFNYENQTSQMNTELHERFYRVLNYCYNHYNQKITISQLADAEHITKNYFSQFLSKTVFQSFSSMIKYIRCYEAEQLLLTTDMAIADISYACGFSDSKYLYAAFRQWWGTTPAEHRSNYMEYMKETERVSCMEALPAQDFLRETITRWHIEKTLRA